MQRDATKTRAEREAEALARARARLSPGELMLLALSERRVANDNARSTRKVVGHNG